MAVSANRLELLQIADAVAREKSIERTIVITAMEDAIAKANGTIHGLAAGLWTKDVKKAHYVASKLKAGTVWVNTYNVYDTAMSFGGFKQSGFGREIGTGSEASAITRCLPSTSNALTDEVPISSPRKLVIVDRAIVLVMLCRTLTSHLHLAKRSWLTTKRKRLADVIGRRFNDLELKSPRALQ